MFYTSPIGLTQQFRFCGNAFRVDMYKGCDFGCSYCFAALRGGNISFKAGEASIEQVEKLFKKVFDTDKEYKDVTVELMRKKIPFHLGGMSDPFQSREFKYRLTYKFLALCKKYNYPVVISTKVAKIKGYLEVLDNKKDMFQISLMGYDEEFIRKYEKNTPSAKERILFMAGLKDRGFFVSLRLQPLIDIEQAEKVVIASNDFIDYITVEHLKIPTDNKSKELFNQENYYRPKQGRNKELLKDIKIRNINRIKQIAKVPIGVGDNDLHELSESRCCCGIDLFYTNWLKYNYTYFITGEVEKDLWIPKNSVVGCFNSETKKKGLITLKDYVDYYVETMKK